MTFLKLNITKIMIIFLGNLHRLPIKKTFALLNFVHKIKYSQDQGSQDRGPIV